MRLFTYQKHRRRRADSTTRTSLLSPSGYLALSLLTVFAQDVQAQSDATAVTMNARWGQASALLGSLFIVQGGKTQGTSGGGYTYTSGPNDASMFALDLSAPFSVSSPPWQNVSVSPASTAAPAVSFHTLSPINSTSLLLFGGDGSPVVPVQTNNDSAYIVHLDQSSSQRTATYTSVSSSWSQPMRRIYHTSESNVDGSIWIMGGEKADGSDLLLNELWTLNINASSPRFGLGSASPPGSIVGSTSTLLSDGTLLLLGGMDASGQLQSMQQVFAYSTKSQKWTQTGTQASSEPLSKRQTASSSTTDAKFPSPRRNHAAVSLPNQRVFVQGGASADLSTVYSDAWILDWSVNPPMWTQLNTTGGPAARYGHAAVAYGRQVVLALGWSGGNAADSTVHVFDGTSLTASSEGSWSGGIWTSTYTPDPQAMQSSSSSDTTGSNGSSSSSGGRTNPSGSGSNAESGGSSTTSGGFPTNGNPGSNGTANEDSGPSDGAKAGAALGAIIGAGLVVGGAYAVYRRRKSLDYRRYGDGSGGLLDGPDRRAGSDPQNGFILEKGFMQSDYDRPYHRTDRRDLGEGLTGGAYYGRKRGRSEGTPWTLGNVGHAMEGSGPHFRERLAILTGLGRRESQPGKRFDMLADEVDGSSILRPRNAALVEDEQDEDADSPLWHNQPLQEHSYARVGDEDPTMGDIGRSYDYGGNHQNDDYMKSPFEDGNEELGIVRGRAMGARAGTGLLAAAGVGMVGKRAYDKLSDDAADNEDRYDLEDHRSDVGSHDGPSSGPSVQSHSTTGKSEVPSSSRSGDIQSPGGIISFSDSTSFGRSSGNHYMIKRSPTWWDRFMGNSLLERSASGRLLTGPGANLPIRDPAPPPLVSNLEAITESPRSREVSEAMNPFADSNRGQDLPRSSTYAGELDEMGRMIGSSNNGSSPFSSYQHGRSLSSLGSARTNASSHFESRIRNMDVVQRVRTGSSRRTASTVRTGSSTSDYSDSEPALSRGPTILLPRNLGPLDETDTVDSIPGSVIWEASAPTAAPESGTALGDVAEEEDESALRQDGQDQDSTFLSPFGDRKDWRASNVSETPSITPLTTKRARLNPLMTAQLFPSPLSAKSPTQPFSVGGSVKDRVKAIESQQISTPTNMPDSSSSSVWTASLSSAHSLNLLATTPTSASMTISPTVTTTDTARSGMERHASTSASSISNSAETGGRGGGEKTKKIKYTHGLVPKPQLFVANPDDGTDSRRIDIDNSTTDKS